jgi:hypothetical protein
MYYGVSAEEDAIVLAVDSFLCRYARGVSGNLGDLFPIEIGLSYVTCDVRCCCVGRATSHIVPHMHMEKEKRKSPGVRMIKKPATRVGGADHRRPGSPGREPLVLAGRIARPRVTRAEGRGNRAQGRLLYI